MWFDHLTFAISPPPPKELGVFSFQPKKKDGTSPGRFGHPRFDGLSARPCLFQHAGWHRADGWHRPLRPGIKKHMESDKGWRQKAGSVFFFSFFFTLIIKAVFWSGFKREPKRKPMFLVLQGDPPKKKH